MLEIASQITLCLLIAALIGFIIGFSIGKWGAKKPTKKIEDNTPNEVEAASEEETKIETNTTNEEREKDTPAEVEAAPEEEIEIPTKEVIANAVEAIEALENNEAPVIEDETTITEGTKPELLDAPRENVKDELTNIKGIGPKVEEQLNAAGIYHFDQIANWTDSNIKWLETHTTFAHRAKKDLWVNQSKTFI